MYKKNTLFTQYLCKIVDVLNIDLIFNNNTAIRFLTFYFSFYHNFSFGLGDNLERKVDKSMVPHITFINIVEILFISDTFFITKWFTR